MCNIILMKDIIQEVRKQKDGISLGENTFYSRKSVPQRKKSNAGLRLDP